MAVINANSFPPGSSRAFIESILNAQKQTDSNEQQGNQNADDLSQLQQAVNLLSSELQGVSSTATSALQTANSASQVASQALAAANSAGNGVGDINMTAVFKNVVATQTVGGPLGASQFNVGGNQVVGGRQGGWTASPGTGATGGINADTGYSTGPVYSQAEFAAVANGLIEARKLAVALQNALTAHGLIG